MITLAAVKPFFDWLQLHPFLAGIITYFISFLECLTVVGLLVPGTVFMTAIGTLIGIGVLPFTSITLWAIAGAITGDVLSFLLGRHYYQHTQTFWLFRRYPNLLNKGKSFFDKHGGKSIFVGRFMGPIRAILPFIAGMVHMPYRQFLTADIVSAIAWAPIYMLPGILLGQASQQLPPEVATKLILFVVLLLLFIWLVYSLVKSCYGWFIRLLDKQVAYLWRFTRNHPRLASVSSFLMDPQHPQSHTQLALILVCLFSLLGFLTLAISVTHHGIATYFNTPIYHLMHSLRTPHLDNFFVAVTLISPRGVLAAFWLVILMVLLIKRNFWTALHWAIVGALSFSLGAVVKHALHIPRPTGLIQTPSGYSFPSGHTVGSVSILGFFAILISLNRPRYVRLLIYTSTSLLIFLILFSRIYLTAHWLSDVIGGVLLGLSIITGLTLSYRRKQDTTPVTIASLVSIGLLTLLLSWGTNLYYNYKHSVLNYHVNTQQQVLDLNAWWTNAERQPPIYQMNRLGHSAEILNIQWAGKLTTLQHSLQQQGWKILPKANFFTTLYNLSLHNHDPATPLFISSNAGQKPVLTMTKYFSGNHTLLIFELWKSPKKFSNGLHLWSGLVRYQKTWRLQFKPLNKQYTVGHFLAADKLLLSDLKQYQVKKVYYPRLGTSVLFIK